MAIAFNSKRLAFGWTDPKKVFNDEAFEDGQPFMQDMHSRDYREWNELVQRAGVVDQQRGRDMVIEAWEKQVLANGHHPQDVAAVLRKQIETLEAEYKRKALQTKQQEMERVFKEEIEKSEALSESELEAIDSPIETTRNLLLAAGYGSKWFRIDKMDAIHRAMARRLRDNDMLEKRAVYNEQAFSIFVVHRLKGT